MHLSPAPLAGAAIGPIQIQAVSFASPRAMTTSTADDMLNPTGKQRTTPVDFGKKNKCNKPKTNEPTKKQTRRRNRLFYRCRQLPCDPLESRPIRPYAGHKRSRLARSPHNPPRGRLHPLGRMAQGKGGRMKYSPHDEESFWACAWLLIIVLILWLVNGGTSL